MLKIAFALIMALPTSVAFAQTMSPLKTAEALTAQFDTYWNASNAAGLTSLYAPDAVINYPEGPIEGQAAILKKHEETFKFPTIHKARVTKVNKGDTLQWAIGVTTVEFKKDGKDVKLTFHFANTYELVGNEYKISTLTFNMVPPK